jgi:hypothetical protein
MELYLGAAMADGKYRKTYVAGLIDRENTVYIYIYTGPSSYDQLDIRTTWVMTKIFLLIFDQVLSYDPHSGQGHLSYDPHGVRKL